MFVCTGFPSDFIVAFKFVVQYNAEAQVGLFVGGLVGGRKIAYHNLDKILDFILDILTKSWILSWISSKILSDLARSLQDLGRSGKSLA